MAQRRVHVIVEGRVQGVFFRAYTRDEARRNGLVGWVRNRPDGSVESLVEGEAAAVERMLAWFAQGSPMSLVTRVRTREEEPVGEHSEFAIHTY
ncbi:MAG: acylphosphatase [Thermodesulfobacteriota bacterium]